MPAKKSRRLPPNTYWRKEAIWAKVDVAGVRYRQSLRTDDPKVAAKRIEALRGELSNRVHFGEARRGIEEVIAAWGEHLTDRVSENTAARYILSLKMLEPYLAGKALSEIDGTLIAEIIKGRRADGRSVATIKRDLVALSQVMGFAIDEGWLESNPVLPRLGRLKERRDPITLPEHADIEIVARRAPGRFEAMIRAALLTGCRQEELASARATQFDAGRRQLTVIGKRNKRRVIDLSDAAVEVVRPPKGHTWLFQASTDGRFKSAKSRWRNLCHGDRIPTGPNNDGITPFPYHHLRHRFAVDYLKAGHSIYMLQQHLGHTSVKTTEMYLEYLTPAEQQRAKFGLTQGTKKGTEAKIETGDIGENDK